MNKEEKQLLLTDICERLPYGLKVQYTAGDGAQYDCGVDMVSVASRCVGLFEIEPKISNNIVWRGIEHVKPYLRPMSSMTEEESFHYKHFDLLDYSNYGFETPNYHCIDWLNRNHFDYRGLIEKGLALEAPEGLYKTE